MTPKKIKYKGQEYRLVESKNANEELKRECQNAVDAMYDAHDILDSIFTIVYENFGGYEDESGMTQLPDKYKFIDDAFEQLGDIAGEFAAKVKNLNIGVDTNYWNRPNKY